MFRPGLCPAAPRAVSSREGPSQRHRASAGGHVAPCTMLGAGSAPTPLPAPVNCTVGFLLPCPGVQCIHCYCCLLPPLKITLSFKHQPQRGTAVLCSCKAQDSVFSWALNAQKRDVPCWAPGRWHSLASTRPPGTPSPVTAAWLLTASEPREHRSGKAQL